MPEPEGQHGGGPEDRPTRLEGRVALVTGMGRGIGRAVAQGLAAEGMSVAGTARSLDEVGEVVAAIERAGGTARGFGIDVTDAGGMRAMVDDVVRDWGRLDLVIANAGDNGDGFRPVREWDPAAAESIMATNYLGFFNTAVASIDALSAGEGGKLLVVGSGAGHAAAAGAGPYGASKAAVSMLAKILATELREARVAVNEVVPGPVRTRLAGFGDGAVESDDAMLAALFAASGEWMKDPADVVELFLLLARYPNDGPSGQVFSLAGRVIG